MALAVNDRSPSISSMWAQWSVIGPLMNGTQAMRDAGEALLPRFPSEDVTAWGSRVKLSTLFPAFKRTCLVMAGKPFSKLAVLSEDTPIEIAGKPANPDAPGFAALTRHFGSLRGSWPRVVEE